MRLFSLIFFLVVLGLSAVYLDTNLSPNSTSRVLPIITWFEEGTLCIDTYQEQTMDKSVVDGHYYSDKAPLPTFLVLPIYGTLKALGLAGNYHPLLHRPVYFLGGFFCGSLPFALIAWLMLKYVPRDQNPKWSVWWATLPLFGSFLFVFAGSFYNHVLSAAFVLSAYLLLRYEQKYLWAGLLAGMAFLTEFPMGLLLPIWLGLLWWHHRQWRPSILFFAGFAPALLFILCYNGYFTGSPFRFLYQMVAHEDFARLSDTIGFQYPHPSALWGLIMGQYRGLLFYLPLLVPVVWVAIQNKVWKGIQRSDAYLWGFVGIHFLLISTHAIWWGGWSYGPRHLAAPAILLLFEGLRMLAKQRISALPLWIAGGFGLICALLAKATVLYAIPSEEAFPVFGYLAKKWQQGIFNEHNLLTQVLGIDPKISIFVWLGLFLFALSALQIWHRRLISKAIQP